MPREQGVRADNGADFPEHPPRQELSFGGQANALIVGEAQPARAELRAEHAILGLEIVDHVALLLVDPARQGHNEELERIREPSQELSVSEERSGLVQVASSPGYISQARSIARISTPIELLDTTRSAIRAGTAGAPSPRVGTSSDSHSLPETHTLRSNRPAFNSKTSQLLQRLEPSQ